MKTYLHHDVLDKDVIVAGIVRTAMAANLVVWYDESAKKWIETPMSAFSPPVEDHT